MLDRLLANDYEAFVDVVYKAMDRAIIVLESGSKHRSGDSEDRTTSELCGLMEMAGFFSKHDIQTGGHVDITVQLKQFVWLGEAKIFTSKTVMRDGYLQLTTRYANGSPAQAAGGMLAYIKTADAAGKMQTWRNEAETTLGLRTNDCPTRLGLAFFTTSNAVSSGLPYKVRHMAVMLHHSPAK